MAKKTSGGDKSRDVGAKFSRTLIADVQKVVDLRIARGWTQSDLAKKAKCSLKTITNFEGGNPAFLNTVERIANALNAVPADILNSDGKGFRKFTKFDPLVNDLKLYINVQMELNIDRNLFDETFDLKKLLDDISSFINAHGKILVRDVVSGSVTLHLGMLPEDVFALMMKAIQGELLKHYNIIRVGFYYPRMMKGKMKAK